MNSIEKHKTGAVEKAKVLVVEDHPINIKVITLLLQQCGITNITVARDGKEALTVFSSAFDLVILDIGLPDISGVAVCREMRERLNGKPLPIIACTADQTSEHICKEVGTSDFILKPITFNVIQAMIQRWVQ